METPNLETVQKHVLGTVLTTIRLALADKALTWVALLGCLGFTGWALLNPEPFRLGGAAGYAVLVFWPVLFKQK